MGNSIQYSVMTYTEKNLKKSGDMYNLFTLLDTGN